LDCGSGSKHDVVSTLNMEERNGQIYGRDFHEDLQRLGRIAADIGSDDLEEEIHLCFTNGFSQILPAHNTPEFKKPVVLQSVVEVGWMSVLSQMESNAKIYAPWAELLQPITNSSMESKLTLLNQMKFFP
jgi:hypothetical protein